LEHSNLPATQSIRQSVQNGHFSPALAEQGKPRDFEGEDRIGIAVSVASGIIAG
jgi:hypothetical protein